MSIYKQILREDFYKLHPMLQKRYEFPNESPFKATGVMKRIQGGPRYLYALFLMGVKCKLLFPEQGEDIPFSIINTPYKGKNGETQIHWERTFYFGKKRRYFNALMSLDRERKIVKDYLGEPPVFYSDLSFRVTSEGTIEINSRKQRLVLGNLEIPLPKWFQGLAFVTEKYCEHSKTFQISVQVKNPIFGTIFAYEGEFVPNEG
ncbi:DUF4166 domain-containing protein [Bacillus dakarensis]|uniref:DUF4166 domain-containing protein n=1 Tax=Robertmurraya dakarensis TaxID=1926278 RepID=UPI00098241CB|nr:DUF4166 domain-containing protein [Bacillus dakarensis]